MDTKTDHAARYPQHMVQEMDKGRPIGEPRPCGTGGLLVLMEQAGRAPDGCILFCLRCVKPVVGTMHEYSESLHAATAEGWKPAPVRVGPVLPGDLSDATRRQVSGLYRLDTLGPCPEDDGLPRNDPNKDTKPWIDAQDDASAKGANAFGLKLATTQDGNPYGVLTEEGRVDDGGGDHGRCDEQRHRSAHPDYHRKYAARAKDPNPRKIKTIEPSAPMICTCGHTVGLHTGSAPRGSDVPCRHSGCKCTRYRQAKPVKESSVPKTKRNKKVAAA